MGDKPHHTLLLAYNHTFLNVFKGKAASQYKYYTHTHVLLLQQQQLQEHVWLNVSCVAHDNCDPLPHAQ